MSFSPSLRKPTDFSRLSPDIAPPRISSVESPCIKICQLDADSLCRGCGRTINEITGWRTMSDEARRAINERVGFRGHPR